MTNTLIAFTGDWHARGKDLDALVAQLEQLALEIKRRGITILCIAGDIFDSESVADAHAGTGKIVQALNGFFRSIAPDCHTYMIPGNHDKASGQAEDALHCLGLSEHITIFHRPGVVSIGNVHMAVIPWEWNPDVPAEQAFGRQLGKLIDAPLLEAHVLFAHVEVGGAVMDGKKPCPMGAGKWRVSREFLERITPMVNYIVLGHFHKRQELVDGRGGFVGALTQHHFGHEGNPTGFEVWDSDTKETEWVELDAAPRYRTVRVEGDNPNTMIEVLPNVILRVITDTDMPPGKAKALRAAGVRVKIEKPTPERVHRTPVPDGVAGNPQACLDLWAGEQDPPVPAGQLVAAHNMLDELMGDKVAKEGVAK